jgi:hypothetical protein
MDFRDTPVFVNNFNRLDIGFRDLLLWLRRAGMTKIAVIDNASTYPPLLAFYDSPAMEGIQLLRAGANLGPEAFWCLDLHFRQLGRHIVTDPDVVPDPQCPLDLVRKMHEVTDRSRFAPTGAKVGPAIRIDNIPSHFAQRDHMRTCEADYWVRRYPEGDCWNAAIDTTFALYDVGWTRWPLVESGGVQHVRLDFPYVVRHLPWYEDSANPSAEAIYYRAHVENGYSSSCPVAIPEETDHA